MRRKALDSTLFSKTVRVEPSRHEIVFMSCVHSTHVRELFDDDDFLNMKFDIQQT